MPTNCAASSRTSTRRASELPPSRHPRAPLAPEDRPGQRPAGARILSAALAVFSLALGGGCATTGRLFTPVPTVEGTDPWQIPVDAYPTQRLYRVKYRGPEGDLGFKLTLYLTNETSYRMQASDLGRKLWSLTVEAGSEATWVSHQRKEVCHTEAAEELRFVPLGDLPLVALPKLLLGRLPAEPAANLSRDSARVAFLDARGQLWNAGIVGQDPEWWSLVEAGEVVVWWRREDDGGVFADNQGEQEVRWREIVRESLETPVAAVTVPSDYRSIDCDQAAAG